MHRYVENHAIMRLRTSLFRMIQIKNLKINMYDIKESCEKEQIIQIKNQLLELHEKRAIDYKISVPRAKSPDRLSPPTSPMKSELKLPPIDLNKHILDLDNVNEKKGKILIKTSFNRTQRVSNN